MAICEGTGFTTWALTPGGSYWGPFKGEDTPCACSTVTWGLFAACGTCQNETAIPWSMWAYNCSNIAIESFPITTLQQVVIPHWAYLGVGNDGQWNETAAYADTQNPQHSHHTPVGAIVGGVIGGLAAFAIAIALFAVLYRRLRHGGTKRPNSIPYKSEGASLDRPRDTITQPTVLPSLAPGHSMHPKLYDPSDPSTFPPLLNYDHTNAAYTSSSEIPRNYRTTTGQTPN